MLKLLTDGPLAAHFTLAVVEVAVASTGRLIRGLRLKNAVGFEKADLMP
jgi:membrane protein YdbS with pleckstrin-like domain